MYNDIFRPGDLALGLYLAKFIIYYTQCIMMKIRYVVCFKLHVRLQHSEKVTFIQWLVFKWIIICYM